MKLQSINPHDQSVVGELVISTPQDILDTVNKANKAFQDWRFTPLKDRIEFIKKYRQKIANKKEEFAKLATLEMGKPLQQSLDDIGFELEFLDYYINNAAKFLADETVLEQGNNKFRTTLEPYGVCACIAPWNFPLSMVNSGIIPALLAGNTIILKPSEYTSLCQKMIINLLNETGLPDGVANIVIGRGDVGSLLVDSPVDLVWFTGSTKVGQEIFEKCGKKFIKSVLEMGGSSPGIVFADANLDNALENLYWGRFLNCGQVCTAIKRLFIEDSIFTSFVQKFVEKLQTLKVGNPIENADIGPLVNQKQLKLLEKQVADAVSKGAKVEIGGRCPDDQNLKNGNYYLPTILTNVNFDMRVLTEEVFGPVLSIIPFKTEEEVVKMANNTDYGLSAEIYTQNLSKGEKIAKQINAGTVAINTDNFFKPECPFGGYKKSGFGREYGRIGMQEFSQVKLIAVSKV